MTASVLASVAVPATTANLGPGYDAFGMALGLRARFTAVARDGQGPLVRTTGTGGEGLATGDDNLAWRSLLAACDHFDWEVPDAALVVDTPIPQARGLGSSSAAIVGGIALARVLARADASVEVTDEAVGDVALVRLAAELEGHPDNVAASVHGGLVACARTDDGALVTRLAPPPADRRPVLLVPATASLTVEARAAVPSDLPREDVASQAARAGHVLAGLTGVWPIDTRLAGDRLHEPVRTAALPGARKLLDDLRGAGRHAWLSGAGPAIAVSLPRCDAGALDEVRTAAEASAHDVLVLDWDRQGVRSCVPDGCGVAGAPGCSDCPLPTVG